METQLHVEWLCVCVCVHCWVRDGGEVVGFGFGLGARAWLEVASEMSEVASERSEAVSERSETQTL